MAPRSPFPAALLLRAALALLLVCRAAAFVRVHDLRFVDEECKEIAFLGANT